VRNEVNRLNVIDSDIAKVTIGTPVDVTATPPTQDALDRQAFGILVSDWLAKKKDASAAQIASLAQSTFDTIRGDDPATNETFRIGSASDGDEGKIKRVVGITIVTA